MPLDGLGDGPKTGAAIALREVADTAKVHVVAIAPDLTTVTSIDVQALRLMYPVNEATIRWSLPNALDTKLLKVVPSGSVGSMTYSLRIYTPVQGMRDTNVVTPFTGDLTQLGGKYTDPFKNEIFSLEDNNAFTSVKSIPGIASQFGEGWDYSILQARVPSVKGGAKDSTLYAELWTDYASAGKSDYMVGGWWLLAPNNPAGDYRFGAISKGEKHYPRSGIGPIKPGVTGKATYKGPAAGLHTSSEDGIQRLLGKVTLNADFGNASARGTIGGKIDSLTLGGESIGGEILLHEVTLNQYTSDFRSPLQTSSTLNKKTDLGNIKGINYRGDWAGTFLGDPSGTDQPTGMVGVVGGSGGGNSFVASFGAKKEKAE